MSPADIDRFNKRINAAAAALGLAFRQMLPMIEETQRNLEKMGIVLAAGVKQAYGERELAVAIKRYNGRLRYERRMERQRRG